MARSLTLTVDGYTRQKYGDASVRWGCDVGPIDGLVSIRGRFDWRAPMVIPACLLKMSPSE
jgi:hypothetical protein